jgi:hypothetical protein
MPKVQSLADLKRLPIGTKLRLVHSLLGPVPEEWQGRRVSRIQSNALVVEITSGPKAGVLSWLYFPKAKDLHETPNGFEVNEEGEVAARYEFE